MILFCTSYNVIDLKLSGCITTTNFDAIQRRRDQGWKIGPKKTQFFKDFFKNLKTSKVQF